MNPALTCLYQLPWLALLLVMNMPLHADQIAAGVKPSCVDISEGFHRTQFERSLQKTMSAPGASIDFEDPALQWTDIHSPYNGYSDQLLLMRVV